MKAKTISDFPVKSFQCFEYKSDGNTLKSVRRELHVLRENFGIRLFEESDRTWMAAYVIIGSHAAIYHPYYDPDREGFFYEENLNKSQESLKSIFLGDTLPPKQYYNKAAIALLESENIDTKRYLDHNAKVKQARADKEAEEKAIKDQENRERTAKYLKDSLKTAYDKHLELKNEKMITYKDLITIIKVLAIEVHPRTMGYINEMAGNYGSVGTNRASFKKGTGRKTKDSIFELADKVAKTEWYPMGEWENVKLDDETQSNAQAQRIRLLSLKYKYQK